MKEPLLVRLKKTLEQKITEARHAEKRAMRDGDPYDANFQDGRAVAYEGALAELEAEQRYDEEEQRRTQ